MHVFFICIMTLVGCTQKTMKLPAKNAVIKGNDTIAIQKGDYLYFVNCSQSFDVLEDGNNKGGQYSAIYRAKLGENNTIIYKYDDKLESVAVITVKVCGFEKTAFYIFGDYIYYTT